MWKIIHCFSNYKLGNKKLGRAQFKEILEWYEKLRKEDRVAPIEMLQCLPDSDGIVVEMKKIEKLFKMK